MADYSKTSLEIVDAVGGKDNIISVSHCATRLRLVLKDKKKYDAKVIDKIDGVQGLFFNSGQLQIIFGLNVPQVFKSFVETTGISGTNQNIDTKIKKQNIFMAALKTLPSIIMPTLNVMVGCALVTAILTIINTICVQGFNVNINDNPWYLLFNSIGSLCTSFLVLYICISAARLWNVNIFIAAAVGIFLVAGPSLGTLIPNWANYERNPITGLPYAASIFTGIVAIKFCSIIEKWLNNKVSDNWKMFAVAGPCIVLTIIFSILFFGPIMSYLEKGLDIFSKALSHESLQGFGIGILAFLFAPLVITGIHQVFIPIIINNIINNKFDYLTMCMLASNLAQGAAAIVVAIKSKDTKIKSLGYSSGVIALLGITEPAMFGINLRNKKAFFSAMLGAFIGGWFLGFMKVAVLSNGGSPSVLSLLFALPDPSIEAHTSFTYLNLVWMLIGMIISIGSTFLFALIFFKETKTQKATWWSKKINVLKAKYDDVKSSISNSKLASWYRKIIRNIVFIYDKRAKNEFNYPQFKKLGVVNSPIEGEFKPLSKINDPTFSNGIIGIGVAINPKNGRLIAPFNGEITMLFDTKHAIGLKSNDGIELLIHIGMDTVSLNGKYFKSKVRVGDKVKEGETLIKFNIKKLKKSGFDLTTPIIIVNKEQFQNISLNQISENEYVNEKQTLINVQ